MELIKIFSILHKKNKINLSKTISFEELMKLKNLNKLREKNDMINRKIYSYMYSKKETEP